jgi:hypothetical protein
VLLYTVQLIIYLEAAASAFVFVAVVVAAVIVEVVEFEVVFPLFGVRMHLQ